MDDGYQTLWSVCTTFTHSISVCDEPQVSVPIFLVSQLCYRDRSDHHSTILLPGTKLYLVCSFILLPEFTGTCTCCKSFQIPFCHISGECSLFVQLFYHFQDIPSVSERPAFNSWATLPLYFGTAIYAFEGIGVVSLKHLLVVNHVYTI